MDVLGQPARGGGITSRQPLRHGIQILILLLPIYLAAQSREDLRSVSPAIGPDTAKNYRLRSSGQIDRLDASKRFLARLTNLPPAAMIHNPKILAVYDFDNDGCLEVFIAWFLTNCSYAEPVAERVSPEVRLDPYQFQRDPKADHNPLRK
jgi:hypothetical protein